MLQYLKGFGKWLASTLFTTVVIVVLVLLIQKHALFDPKPAPPSPPAPVVNPLEEAWKNDADGEKVLHRDQLASFLEVAAQRYVSDPSLFKRRSDIFGLLHKAADHYLGNSLSEERKALAAEWLVLLKQDADLTEQDRKLVMSMFQAASDELRKLK